LTVGSSASPSQRNARRGGGHSLLVEWALFVHLLVGLLRGRLARVLAGFLARLLRGLLLLALLLLPLLTLALLLLAILWGLRWLAVLLVHLWPSMVFAAASESTSLLKERSLFATGCPSPRSFPAGPPQDVEATT